MIRRHHFLSIFLIILSALSLIFTPKASAAITYTQSGKTITITYQSTQDFIDQCSYEPSFWMITLAYDNFNSYAKSPVHPVSENPISYTFDIPDGTNIQSIEAWTGDTEENTINSSCQIVLDYNINGVFTWGATPTPTPTPVKVNVTKVVTPTNTPTPSPSPTPLPDKTPPNVSIDTNLSKSFVTSPLISGKATDNKDVTKVEYSTDGGKNFLPVDNISSLGKNLTSFTFTPNLSEDGNYAIVVRATDSSGNVGLSKNSTLIIDRLPPQISGVLYTSGPQILTPDKAGDIILSSGQKLKITLSEVGGTTGVDIDAKFLNKNSKKVYLKKNTESGLWTGELILENEGEYILSASLLDGGGNKITRNLNVVKIVENGRVIAINNNEKAKITVYFQEPKSKIWQVWDGSSYQQKNPFETDSDGFYSLFLPSGKYYLHVEKNGYQSLNTDFFQMDKPSPINASFTLKPLRLLFSLFFLKIYIPNFSEASVKLTNNLPDVQNSENKVVGNQLPYFNLQTTNKRAFTSDNLKGKPSVLSFINTWSPPSSEQTLILNNLSKNKNFNSATIVVGEKFSQVYVYQKRGDYSMTMIADPDSTLAVPFGLNALPTHLFIDRRGVVRDAISGVLSQKEIEKILTNISD